MTNQYQEDWFAHAAGRKTDPDGDGSFDCCDTPKDYHQAIFGVGWKLGWPGAGNARDMLYSYDTDYYTQILNNPNDPNLLPERGDIIVWNGNAYNPYGHIGVVLGATANGVTIMQEDTGLQVPMFVGTLNYYLATAGMVSGWLRPNFSTGTVSPTGGGITPILAGNQRRVGASPINEHAYANTTSPVVRVAPAASLEQFTGWLHGQPVTINGFTSDIWFTDAQGAEWCGGFEDQGTHDLKDMNPILTGTQRKVSKFASNEHTLPSTTSPVIRSAAPGSIEQFTGWTHGESVTATGGFTSDVWFLDAQGAEWCGNFDDQGTHDLPEVKQAPAPVPAPTPAPTPAPVPLAALDIIDVSKFQTQDISAITADGFIIGVTAGMTVINPIWKDQLAAVRKHATELIGLYHAPNQGAETADAAATHFWTTVQPELLGGERLFLDFEFMDLTNVAWAHTFITTLRTLSASKADLYIGWSTERASDFSAMAAPAEDIRIWMAQYPWSTPQQGFVHWDNPPQPKYWKNVEGWQYTSHGRVPVYPTVDLDFSAFYDTADQWKARGVPAPVIVPVPTPTPTPAPAGRPLVLLTPTGDGTTVDVYVQLPGQTQVPADITTMG